MSKLEQLRKRIKDSAYGGIPTAHIRKDDYEPACEMLITGLVNSGEFIARRDLPVNGGDWKIWAKGFEPY